MLRNIITINILLFFLFSPVLIFGYTERTGGGSMEARVTPKNPGPEELVSIRLTGYGFNVDLSRVTWMINNEVINTGQGLRDFSFRTGPVGSISSVHAVVETSSGRRIVKNLIFRPATVELMAEFNTYVPPGYPGARLPTPGSQVKVVAETDILIRNGNSQPEDIDYQWRVNGNIIREQSGPGRNMLIFTLNEAVQNTTVEIFVFSTKHGIRATNSLVITPQTPELILYENQPLLGTNYAKALPEEIGLNADVITIKAEPFYFPVHQSSFWQFLWSLNGNIISANTMNPSQMSFERPTGHEGASVISAEIFNSLNTRERGRREILIHFGQTFERF